jgi:hypothetical protein
MPFGLKMSQDVIQSKIYQTLLMAGPGCIGIADDVIVFRVNEKKHDKNLTRLMDTANKEDLTFTSPNINKRGLKPDPETVSDIQGITMPTNKHKLQHFLGLVTYMSPFYTTTI